MTSSGGSTSRSVERVLYIKHVRHPPYQVNLCEFGEFSSMLPWHPLPLPFFTHGDDNAAVDLDTE